MKSYITEKGKNIATSEDIEGLTSKVESVKQQFLEKNANLKAKLDLLTNLQISHKNDKRLALIDFHKKNKKWIGMLTESSPLLIDDYNNSEIKVKIHLYNQVYQEVLSGEALLELYVKDKDLIKIISDLKISTLKHLAGHAPKFLIKLKHNNNEFKLYEKMPVDTLENIEKKSKKHTGLLEKRKVIFDEYRNNMTEGLKLNMSTEGEYRKYIREYLKNIPEE
ncbi:hypothetical protein D7030_07565 [Flavobacteriaceae bacterium AU392]|nr:hypothetical protein D1817_00855 [Flavobacteriaceae bacterium]RKM84980.1 hypothetical protein D7030_07565 [Flavobacteriaceae bacterium AU392]